MTDHNDTGAAARPWVIPTGDSNEHVICVGDDAGKPGRIICILHPANFSYDRLSYDELTAVAALIVEAVNAYEPLKARLAEVEGQRAELASKLSHLVDSLKHAEARTLDAEASIAVLEKALERIAVLPECGCKPCTGQCRSQAVLLIELEEIRALARVALAAKQKEVGNAKL